MNKLKEKLKLLNLQSFGERVYEQEIHCMFCGKKVLREISCLYEVLEDHKYCEHILFLQHQDGFEHIREDIRQSKQAKEMIEHFAECEKCNFMIFLVSHFLLSFHSALPFLFFSSPFLFQAPISLIPGGEF